MSSMGPSLQSCSPAALPPLVLVAGAIPLQGEEFTFCFQEFHDIPIYLALQPSKVPLNGSTTSGFL